MKKILIGLVFAFSMGAQALEVGDVYQNDATDILHIMPDDTEVLADITAKSPGHTKVFIEFFQTTCGYCTMNRPTFIKLAQEFSTTTTAKLVGLDRNEQALRNFYARTKIEFDFPYVMDLKRAASRAFKITATPTSFILDENGKVLFRHEGTFSPADEDQVRQLLK